jgi:hypothetical protein
VLSADEVARTCTSVFIAQKSTPDNPASIMRFTAFVPPPPTPITLIFANGSGTTIE